MSTEKKYSVHSALFFLKVVENGALWTGGHLGFKCTEWTGVEARPDESLVI